MSKDHPLPKGLKSSPVVERLISGGAQPGEQVTIVGYIGRSSSDGHVRVYLDLALSSYCDIAASDIVGTASVDSQSEISPSILWLKLGAKIDRVDTSRSTTVLSGQIQQNYLQQAMRARMSNYRGFLLPSWECSQAGCVFGPPPTVGWECWGPSLPCPGKVSLYCPA